MKPATLVTIVGPTPAAPAPKAAYKSVCEAPEKEFVIVAEDGTEVPNDTIVHMEQNPEVIDCNGQDAIKRLLIGWDIRGISWYDFDWALKNARGTALNKRISKHVKDETGIKLTPEQMTDLGNSLERLKPKASGANLAFTRDINHNCSWFARTDSSCWFGGIYEGCRCMLKASGGMAILQFREPTESKPEAACWFYPVDEHLESVSSSVADAYILYGGYGSFSGAGRTDTSAEFAKLVAKLLGKKSKQITICSTLTEYYYVYLIADNPDELFTAAQKHHREKQGAKYNGIEMNQWMNCNCDAKHPYKEQVRNLAKEVGEKDGKTDDTKTEEK